MLYSVKVNNKFGDNFLISYEDIRKYKKLVKSVGVESSVKDVKIGDKFYKEETKVYTENFYIRENVIKESTSVEHLRILNSLSKTARDILDLIKYELRDKSIYKRADGSIPNEFAVTTLFYFSYKFYTELVTRLLPNVKPLAQPTFSSTMKELLDAKLIFKSTERSWYNVNWNHYFVGSKARFVKEYYKTCGEEAVALLKYCF